MTKQLRLILISDDDDQVGFLQPDELDVLISLGDLYDVTLKKAIDIYAPEHVLAVRGNHDVISEFPPPTVNLHMACIEIGGIRFGGFAGCWKYKSRGEHLYEQNQVSAMLAQFPPVDVFIAHNSPKGIHERDLGIHQGFEAFIEYIDRAQPRYFFHGHQHKQKSTMRGNTEIIGVYGELAFFYHIENTY